MVNAWNEVADNLEKLALANGDKITLEVTPTKLGDELKASYILPGEKEKHKKPLAVVKKQIELYEKQLEADGYVKVTIYYDESEDGEGATRRIWRHRKHCVQDMHGLWHDRMEYIMDRLGAKVVTEELLSFLSARRLDPTKLMGAVKSADFKKKMEGLLERAREFEAVL